MAGIKVDPPPVNMQIIDMKTGRPTRPFIEFMHRLWQRTGGEVDAIEDLDVTNSYPVFKPTSASDAEIGQPSFLEGQKGASEEQINEAIQNLSALVHAKAPQPDVLDAIESLRAVTLSDMAGLHSEIGELREHVESLITLVMIIERPGRAASDAVSNHVALPDPHSQYADQANTYTETEVNNLLDAKASLQDADITVTVGAGGDYPTINAALEYLSKLQPVYDFAGITATINLLTGFTMAEQVLVRGLDLGWITITGADAETTITNTALTTDFTIVDYGFDAYPAFGVSKGGVLPRIDQLFRFDVANVGGEKRGIMAVGAGSSADVLAGAGVNDAGTDGIYADNGSTIYAEGAVASGAGSYGINASSGSTINAEGANASGAGTYGILATRGSTINAGGANASGAGTYGILATSGSTINAKGADASGAGSYGINASSGSTINAGGATGTLSQAINTVTNNGIIFQ